LKRRATDKSDLRSSREAEYNPDFSLHHILFIRILWRLNGRISRGIANFLLSMKLKERRKHSNKNS
jgi:hypothetical protein